MWLVLFVYEDSFIRFLATILESEIANNYPCNLSWDCHKIVPDIFTDNAKELDVIPRKHVNTARIRRMWKRIFFKCSQLHRSFLIRAIFISKTLESLLKSNKHLPGKISNRNTRKRSKACCNFTMKKPDPR